MAFKTHSALDIFKMPCHVHVKGPKEMKTKINTKIKTKMKAYTVHEYFILRDRVMHILNDASRV